MNNIKVGTIVSLGIRHGVITQLLTENDTGRQCGRVRLIAHNLGVSEVHYLEDYTLCSLESLAVEFERRLEMLHSQLESLMQIAKVKT